MPNEHKVKLQATDENEPFWSLLEKAAKETLSTEEVEKFMTAMKKVLTCCFQVFICVHKMCIASSIFQNYADVSDLINLEDLNVAAAMANSK